MPRTVKEARLERGTWTEEDERWRCAECHHMLKDHVWREDGLLARGCLICDVSHRPAISNDCYKIISEFELILENARSQNNEQNKS